MGPITEALKRGSRRRPAAPRQLGVLGDEHRIAPLPGLAAVVVQHGERPLLQQHDGHQVDQSHQSDRDVGEVPDGGQFGGRTHRGCRGNQHLEDGNAAFADDPGAEVARILRDLANTMEVNGSAEMDMRIADANGNRVGTAVLKGSR